MKRIKIFILTINTFLILFTSKILLKRNKEKYLGHVKPIVS